MKQCIKMPRPTCTTDGCTANVAAIRNFYDDKGNKVEVSWRKYCSPCHDKRTAEKYGLKTITDITARRNGFESTTDYLNSIHRYRRFKKDYCENIDGRLGFTCTTNVVWTGMLDTDHIAGDPSVDDKEEHFQTLCKCCHYYKGYVNKDFQSPGRKTLGVKY